MDSIKSSIQKIEKLEFCDEKDRAKMILVYLRLKPACEVYVFKQGDIIKLKQTLLGVGLHCIKLNFDKKPFDEIQKNIPQKLMLPVGQYAVARNEKTAVRLSKTMPNKHHWRFGRLMGYPQTAIDNFIKKEPKLDGPEYIRLYKKHGIIFSFRIPAKNYSNSIKLLKRWSVAIKRYAPDLYETLLRYQASSLKMFH